MSTQLGTFQTVAPLLLASGWAILVLIAEMFAANRRHVGIGWLCVVGLGAVAWSARTPASEPVFGAAIALDGLTCVSIQMLCALSIVAILMAIDYLPRTGVQGGEYYPLLLFAVVGLIVMAAATDLIVMFLGLETMSMAVYVLAGVWKREPRSSEAALKYFLLGAFASGFMLYGIALVYGAAGSTALIDVSAAAASKLGSDESMLLFLGIGLLLVGFAFKIAAVPFHLWTPDVYEGAPTSVTAFMSTAVKLGAFAAMIRTVMIALAPAADQLTGVLWATAVVTMTVGNVVALRQTSLKRMLAYSSIAHTGYLLVGLTAGTREGAAAMLFYLAAYGAMNLAAFGVMMILSRRGDGAERISDYAGLGQSSPMLAVAMTLCMLSLIGIPPLGGFMGKVYLFSAALAAGHSLLVVIAVLNSVLSAAYYLGVVRVMYFDSARAAPAPSGGHLMVATLAAVAAILILGIAPSAVLEAARGAAEAIVLGNS